MKQERTANVEKVAVRRVIHTIHATADIGACRAKYMDILGGVIFAEGYFAAEDRDMALLYAADHMIEPMAPREASRSDKPFARYLQKYGEGFHSFEIKVDDGPRAAARFRDSGCKLASDYGQFFFVRQESTGGILLEVCQLQMPNDPHDRGNWRPECLLGHPSGLLKLDHIACITSALDTAVHFFTELCDGEMLADEDASLPQPGRRVLLRLGDKNVAFLQPDDHSSGPAAEFLRPPSSGLYAHVWQVEDILRTEAFMRDKGLRTTRENCVSNGFAIHPEDFLGGRHEFIAG